MLMATFDDIFDCVFQVHFCQPAESTKEAQPDTMPVTNKLPEMEISRCLCGQTEEHDEMKKNSLTLLCLFRLCSTHWNTNPDDYLHHFHLIFFLSTEVESSNHEENILDVDLIHIMLYNTFTYRNFHLTNSPLVTDV